jgi:hypothetical protein
MDNLTDYTESKIIGVLAGTTWTPPTQYYIGLYNAIPTDVGGGTYIFDAARLPVNWVQVSGSLRNGSTLTWPVATTEWGEVQAFGVFDGSTGASNLIWYGAFDAPYIDIGIGEQFIVDPQEIVLTIS